jgi:hypothetical protein
VRAAALPFRPETFEAERVIAIGRHTSAITETGFPGAAALAAAAGARGLAGGGERHLNPPRPTIAADDDSAGHTLFLRRTGHGRGVLGVATRRHAPRSDSALPLRGHISGLERTRSPENPRSPESPMAVVLTLLWRESVWRSGRHQSPDRARRLEGTCSNVNTTALGIEPRIAP